MCVDLNEKSTSSFLSFFLSFSGTLPRGSADSSVSGKRIKKNFFLRKYPIKTLQAAVNLLPEHEEADPPRDERTEASPHSASAVIQRKF